MFTVAFIYMALLFSGQSSRSLGRTELRCIMDHTPKRQVTENSNLDLVYKFAVRPVNKAAVFFGQKVASQGY